VTNSDGRTVERRKQFLTIKTDKRLGMTKGFGGKWGAPKKEPAGNKKT
jgi:hypothetical protein